jgi:DNA (cytosine-5)-methyltransferase 1
MNELALFAGAGGGILGGIFLGWRTVCAVEIEPYPIGVLIARQNEGILPPFPIWDDVCTFDGRPWRGITDVVSGGFPCQDISSAGKGAGITGARSGLWKEFARIIDEVRPKYAFVENSPLLRKRGLDVVLSDLAEIGYDAEWCVLGADDVGAIHHRKRMWILAYARSQKSIRIPSIQRQEISAVRGDIEEVFSSDSRSKRIQREQSQEIYKLGIFSWCKDIRGIEDLRNRPDIPEPLLRRTNNGMANYMDRIKSIGNGQVPIVAATAWYLLRERIENAAAGF